MGLVKDRKTKRFMAELTAFAEAYEAGETGPHRGWHAGAGNDGQWLLVYNDAGDEAECVFREGERTLFNIMHGGYRQDVTERGFAVWRMRPGIGGAVDPGVGRLEVTATDGTTVAAEIVAHTFAVDIDTGPSPRTMDEVFDWQEPAFTVRVFDKQDVLRYEGPLRAGR